MPVYKIEIMPGQGMRIGDDPNDLLYQIREYDGAGFVTDERRSRIRFDNLSNEAAKKLLSELQGEEPK